MYNIKKYYLAFLTSVNFIGWTTGLFIPTIFMIASDLSLVEPVITEYLTFSASKNPKIALSTALATSSSCHLTPSFLYPNYLGTKNM